MDFSVVIPARLNSQRLPGKVLLPLGDKPVIQHVWERASASHAARVIIAVDDEKVARTVAAFGAEYCMTSSDHPSGTDRLQEVVSQLGMADDELVINVQGDEPLMPPAVINQLADNIIGSGVSMATLYEPVTTIADALDPNIVKVVTDTDGRAVYFSRAPIPWSRDHFPDRLADNIQLKRHLGIYAYRVDLLNQFVQWGSCVLEETEKLEQLRVIWHGVSIHIDEACETIPPGIDTMADLEKARQILGC